MVDLRRFTSAAPCKHRCKLSLDQDTPTKLIQVNGAIVSFVIALAGLYGGI
jgi:hypothetical protein